MHTFCKNDLLVIILRVESLEWRVVKFGRNRNRLDKLDIRKATILTFAIATIATFNAFYFGFRAILNMYVYSLGIEKFGVTVKST